MYLRNLSAVSQNATRLAKYLMSLSNPWSSVFALHRARTLPVWIVCTLRAAAWCLGKREARKRSFRFRAAALIGPCAALLNCAPRRVPPVDILSILTKMCFLPVVSAEISRTVCDGGRSGVLTCPDAECGAD